MNMKGYLYILKCCDGSYYTGSTNNLELRLAQHQRGEGANHTSKRLPVELVYSEEFDRIDDAFYREKQVQGWSRKKKEALIAGKFEDLPKLAECKNGSCSRAGFDSAQPAGKRRSLSKISCSLSVVEGNIRAGFDKLSQRGRLFPEQAIPFPEPVEGIHIEGGALSKVEGNTKNGFDSAQPPGKDCSLSKPSCSLSVVEGSHVKSGALSIVEVESNHGK